MECAQTTLKGVVVVVVVVNGGLCGGWWSKGFNLSVTSVTGLG
jgi:hypothetical protein